MPQRPTRSELSFRFLECVSQLRERRIQARLLIEGQVRRELWSPFLLCTDDRSTERIAFAPAAIFDSDDLFAVDTRHVAAGEAHQCPADRLVRLSEVQQMLLGLVRIVPDAFGRGGGRRERSTCHLGAYETLDRMQTRARGAPFVLAVPRESFPKHLRHAPSVRIAKPCEH